MGVGSGDQRLYVRGDLFRIRKTRLPLKYRDAHPGCQQIRLSPVDFKRD